jgi:acetyl-CoA C-acetyltransferase
VLSAVRTAIGKYGGGLAAFPPCDLAATVVREAVQRPGVQPEDVGHAVFGHVIHTETRDMYLSRGKYWLPGLRWASEWETAPWWTPWRVR